MIEKLMFISISIFCIGVAYAIGYGHGALCEMRLSWKLEEEKDGIKL